MERHYTGKPTAVGPPGQLDGLDAAVVRRLAFGAMAARPEAVEGMQALVRGCVEPSAPPAGDAA